MTAPIQNHLDDLYGYERSTQTISNITENIMIKLVEEAKDFCLKFIGLGFC